MSEPARASTRTRTRTRTKVADPLGKSGNHIIPTLLIARGRYKKGIKIPDDQRSPIPICTRHVMMSPVYSLVTNGLGYLQGQAV